MKKSELVEGGFYFAKVSDRLVTVRLDKIREKAGRIGYTKAQTMYDCTNMRTGRKVTFASSMKFRGKATDPTKEKPGTATPLAKAVVGPVVDKMIADGALPNVPYTIDQAPKTVEVDGQTVTLDNRGGGTSNRIISEPANHPRSGGLAARITEVNNRPPTDTAPHLFIKAGAGTGKTTTLVGGLQVLKGVTPTDARGRPITPSDQQRAIWEAVALSRGFANSVCFVAFNKSIATELKTRVPPGCDAMTMHSMGYRAINRAFNNPKMEENRVVNIIEELTGKDVRELYKKHGPLVSLTKRLVGLCKMNLIGVGEGWENLNPATPLINAMATALAWPDELAELIAHHDLDTDGVSTAEVFDLVPKVLARCKDVEKDRTIDFDDMVWLPVALNLPVYRYDLLLVDEAQDLNRVQQALVKKAGRRLVFCGDPKQAIYGFAGADCESMPRLERELANAQAQFQYGDPMPRGCMSLPLSVTRRCGKAIVKEANAIVPDFYAHESNCEGTIKRAAYPTDREGKPRPLPHYTEMVEDRDMILCRVNAPLVSQAFGFIRRGRKANIQGRDIAQGLVSTVTRMKANTVADLVEKLSDWTAAEVAKEMKKRHPSESRIIALNDRYDCIMCFTEGLSATAHPSEVTRKIEGIFTDDRNSPGIRLSSIHKAKGLEADRVFLLEPEGSGVPHPMAKTDWQVEQEWNLRYVAITRAIKELVYVT